MSDESWSTKLRKITSLELPEHIRLTDEDSCYFLGEYTPRKGYSHSRTNGIISNLKKSPTKRHLLEYEHKRSAIRQVAAALRSNINPDWISSVTIIPAPPSKAEHDPEYDDRIYQIARQIHPELDVRRLLRQRSSRPPLHASENSRSVDAIAANMTIVEEEATKPLQRHVLLLDDMLTTGATFCACRRLILERFPGASIEGVFVARRVIPPLDFSAFDDF